jgi:hypothetical protein
MKKIFSFLKLSGYISSFSSNWYLGMAMHRVEKFRMVYEPALWTKNKMRWMDGTGPTRI